MKIEMKHTINLNPLDGILRISFFILLLSIGTPVLAQHRGYVSSRPCPYSCRTQGIPKKHCRDWKENGLCYIEDLRKQPNPVQQTQPPGTSIIQTPAVVQRPGSGIAPPYGGSSGLVECQNTRRNQIAPPYVNISRVSRSGNFFKNKYRIYGSIEGICLVDVGAFEDGRKIHTIQVPTSKTFQRVDFDVQVDGDRNVEIRAYNVHGERAVYTLNPNDVR